ncbi:MAG: response regulator [Acidobacteriaceae bacterium]|nr:response regulator [Acidobacteriaceae bacterium]
MKVLLVDDSKVQRWAIQKNLEIAGFTVITAPDGEQGLRLALKEAPDVILLDMLLPKLGGLDVLRLLKQKQETKEIPVIVWTGLCEGNEEKLSREGAAGFCNKSEDAFQRGSAKLIEIIQRALANTKLNT